MYSKFLQTHLLQWIPVDISSNTSAVHAIYEVISMQLCLDLCWIFGFS